MASDRSDLFDASDLCDSSDPYNADRERMASANPHVSGSRASVVAALSVYVEPLVEGARVAVIGDGSPTSHAHFHARLLELGARSVHLYLTPTVNAAGPPSDRIARMGDVLPRGVSVRTLREDFDVRDGAFDLVVIPDLGVLRDPAEIVARLRRVVDARGAVVAMGRARAGEVETSDFPELAAAAVDYTELYDLFALQFESVAMTGVLPFEGVVFALLGASDDRAVSVETHLVDPEPPGVFVVVAGRALPSPIALDPYAIVQVERPIPVALPVVSALVEFQSGPNESLRRERDAAERRARELEEVLNSAQLALGVLERRLLGAEESSLERDDQRARAELAESTLAEHLAKADFVMESCAFDTARIEEQLRERARVVASLESELARRERLIRELLASLEEARDANAANAAMGGAGLQFEAAPSVDPSLEVARLCLKLDELALDIARREGEHAAQAWRIQELENEKVLARASAPPEAMPNVREHEGELGRARDELDALRQALTQEHAARLTAEAHATQPDPHAELVRPVDDAVAQPGDPEPAEPAAPEVPS